ncbi:oligopeptide ABC transporter substrate-binding protein [Lacticaseibacillus saniviri]|nr:oligopeptide ABC transporter substrate-binding protein [Lacticaseibacillus saniviri]MCG4282140.1 oligopeptide ABC transporter substrate-binding protein [Lacticaseibacillus saniviri]
MKKRSKIGMVLLSTALVLTLAACGSKSSNSSSSSNGSTTKLSFPITSKGSGSVEKGGTLSIGIVNDSPFKGVFNEELYTDNFDADFMTPASEALFGTDKDFTINDKGAATQKLDQKAKTATITLKDNVKWSDGQPVTARDIVYAYEIIANPDTKSQRYTESLQNIEGMTEYNAGKAKTISGLEMPDGDNGKTVVIHFKEMKPGMKQGGNGYIWANAAPYHYLKDVAFKDLMSSDKIRKKPLFFGPYAISKIIPGQSVEFVPNKYYYGPKPKLSKITEETVSSASAPSALKNKKYDVLREMPQDNFSDWKKSDGYTNLGQQDLAYSYIAFKLGKWDDKTGENVMDAKAKMANKSLRQAMVYALNNDEISTKFYAGLRPRGTTLIPPVFGDYHLDDKGYTLNIKKANKLLDDAGYKKGSDGYRTDPDGKKLTINFASMAGGETAEPIAQDYIQQWKKIGLRVKLATGRLIEFNSFYDKIQNDDKGIDVFSAAWGLSSEPSPYDLFSAKAPFNYSRFATAENTKLLNDIDSEKAEDSAYRVKAFKAWQKYMLDQAAVVPTFYRTKVEPVSNKVKGYSISNDTTVANYANIELTK